MSYKPFYMFELSSESRLWALRQHLRFILVVHTNVH